jgi:hypothetical protein
VTATRANAALVIAALALTVACRSGEPAAPGTLVTPTSRPSILLVTLDTTRADAIGPDAVGIETPARRIGTRRSARAPR